MVDDERHVDALEHAMLRQDVFRVQCSTTSSLRDLIRANQPMETFRSGTPPRLLTKLKRMPTDYQPGVQPPPIKHRLHRILDAGHAAVGIVAAGNGVQSPHLGAWTAGVHDDCREI